MGLGGFARAGSTGWPTSCPCASDRPVEHGHVAGRRAQLRVVELVGAGHEPCVQLVALLTAPRSRATPSSARRRPRPSTSSSRLPRRVLAGLRLDAAGGRVSSPAEAADAYRELGDRVAVDDPASAEVAYRRALDFEPALPDVYVRLAATLMRLGRLCEAEGQLRAARRLDPRHEEAARLWADLLLARGRIVEAAGVPRAAAPPSGSPLLLTEYGDLLARIGLLEEARIAYGSALAAGECAETRTNLGLLLLERGDREGALEEFERALELDAAACRGGRQPGQRARWSSDGSTRPQARSRSSRGPARRGRRPCGRSPRWRTARGDGAAADARARRGGSACGRRCSSSRRVTEPSAARTGRMSGGRVRRVVLAAIRVAVGIFFVVGRASASCSTTTTYVARFDRWGLPAPSTAGVGRRRARDRLRASSWCSACRRAPPRWCCCWRCWSRWPPPAASTAAPHLVVPPRAGARLPDPGRPRRRRAGSCSTCSTRRARPRTITAPPP